jgi:hypothetical protein
MTEQELEIVRAKMKTEALTVLFLGVCSALARAFPTLGPSLLLTAKEKQIEYQQMVLKGLSPAMSDLMAGEYQEAFEDLISLMEKTLAKKNS